MTAYNKMQEYFNKFYAKFRKDFADFIIEYSNKQYFSWATAVLKVASQNVGYYNSLRSAFYAGTPDGYLPGNLSPIYLREQAVIYSNADLLGMAISGKPIEVTTIGEMVLKTTVFINGEYKTIYIAVDPAKMAIMASGVLLEDMAAATDKIQPLQVQLDATIIRLRTTHNNTFNALQSNQYSADANKQLLDTMQKTVADLIALRESPQYVVKIAKSCFPGETGKQSPFESLIDVIGAVSFDYILPSSNALVMRDVLIDDLKKSDTNIGIMQKESANYIERDNAAAGGSTLISAKATPDSNPGDYWNNDPKFVKDLPEVVVTSSKKAAAKKSNIGLWVVGGLVGYLLMNND